MWHSNVDQKFKVWTLRWRIGMMIEDEQVRASA